MYYIDMGIEGSKQNILMCQTFYANCMHVLICTNDCFRNRLSHHRHKWKSFYCCSFILPAPCFVVDNWQNCFTLLKITGTSLYMYLCFIVISAYLVFVCLIFALVNLCAKKRQIRWDVWFKRSCRILFALLLTSIYTFFLKKK